MRQFRTTEPLRLDILTRDLQGTEKNGAVEAILEANPGLAALGGFAGEGQVLNIPDRPEPQPVPAINPWD